MENSNNKSTLENIECEYEMIKTTMLGKLIAISKMLTIEINSKGKHSLNSKIEIMIANVEINQMIGILTYMNDTIITMKYNLK